MYLEDVIVFSNNHDDHLYHLAQVLSLLEEAGVKLKLKKCFFFQDEVDYLGHIISPGILLVSRDAKAVKAVREARFPEDKTQLQSFLGACNVYRRFVKNYARIAEPLNAMLHKDSGAKWGHPAPTEDDAFQVLKEKLTTPPVLALPQRNLPFMIDCDASGSAIGAVQLQQQDDDNPKQWACLLYTSPSPRDA